MTLRVLAFARVRELLGSVRDVELPPGSTAADLWATLEAQTAELRALAGSTRVARNGRIVKPDSVLQDGDEIALLPPAGGG